MSKSKFTVVYFDKENWKIFHMCKAPKHRVHWSNPVWGSFFPKKYAKLLAHWGNKPKCIRCWAEIPSLMMMAIYLGDKESIRKL